MKTKFTVKKDGITYQGRLPLDVMEQYNLSQLFVSQVVSGEDGLSPMDVIAMRNKLAEEVKQYCNIVKGESELMVSGKAKDGFKLEYLINLLEIYQEELLFPLVS